VEDRFLAFDLTGAYAASVVLALLALAVILSTSLLDRRKRGDGPRSCRTKEAA
jgi:ABC-type sulfate transport system permease subunit